MIFLSFSVRVFFQKIRRKSIKARLKSDKEFLFRNNRKGEGLCQCVSRVAINFQCGAKGSWSSTKALKKLISKMLARYTARTHPSNIV